MKESSFRKNGCCICEELAHHRFPEEFERVYGIANRICVDTDDFVAFPTVSPLTTGHMLIFPTRHVPSLSVLQSDQVRALMQIAAYIQSAVSSENTTGYIFEHGVLEDGIGSCGITHAHLHVVPLPSNVASKVTKVASTAFMPQLAGRLDTILSGNFKTASPYLLFGDTITHVRFAPASSIPSQFMRRTIATVMGLSEWNWRSLTGAETFRATIESFRARKLAQAS